MSKTHQVFIASYAKDFPWLEVNLKSMRKYARGFLPPIVCVDSTDLFEARKIANRVFPEAVVTVKDGRRGQGFMRAQISMMCCDLFTNADFYYLVGSDCMAYKEFTPEQHFYKGKPALLWNSYAEITNGKDGGVGAWQRGTEHLLGWHCPNEYMRRLPIVYPRELFAPFRQHIETRHRGGFEDIIYKTSAAGIPVSESNLLGGFAFRLMPQIYSWLHAGNNPEYIEYRTPDSDSLIQWWSHGGFNRPAETCVPYLPGKNTAGQTPAAVMQELGLL